MNHYSTRGRKAMGGRLGITWKEFDLEQFRRGMVVDSSTASTTR